MATKQQTKTAPAKKAEAAKPEPKAPFRPVKAEEIDWTESESSDDGSSVTAIVRGFELTVEPKMDHSTGEAVRVPGRWFWSVRATSEVSETPELIGIDECATLGGGQRWARQTLNRALRTWKGKGAS